jgi:hypothetical protein
MFRAANETLEEKAAELGFAEERTPYLCECEDSSCTHIVQLSRADYEAVRAHPRRFVMVSGHQQPEDRLVEETAGYTVIEKVGEQGELVAERYPRSAESRRP